MLQYGNCRAVSPSRQVRIRPFSFDHPYINTDYFEGESGGLILQLFLEERFTNGITELFLFQGAGKHKIINDGFAMFYRSFWASGVIRLRVWKVYGRTLSIIQAPLYQYRSCLLFAS